MFSLATRAAAFGSLVLVAAAALLFARQQNRDDHAHRPIGGRISRPKQLWLAFAVYVWFFLCPSLAIFETDLHRSLRLIYGAFSASMWVRGVTELIMMYGTKRWRPPYGVAHDLASILLILVVGLSQWTAIAGLDRPLDLAAGAFLLVVLGSLAVETWYALAFHQAVDGRTTGEDGLWFADRESPRFTRINRITAAVNVPLYLALFVFLAAGLFY